MEEVWSNKIGGEINSKRARILSVINESWAHRSNARR